MVAIPNSKLPCLTTCTHPQADEVRWAIGVGALLDDDDNNRTPSGLPIMCCRVRVLGMVPPGMIVG